jgi:hypothetical protein
MPVGLSTPTAPSVGQAIGRPTALDSILECPPVSPLTIALLAILATHFLTLLFDVRRKRPPFSAS